MSRMKTAIVGLGITGLSGVRYLNDTDDLVVVDTRIDPPGLAELVERFPGVPVATGADRFDFSGVDRVLVSPGVGLDSEILKDLPSNVTLISDIDLFCEAATAPIIAVTGTNGKSTVTSLVGHLLLGAGVRAVVGGNLGQAALDLLGEPAVVFVLELSSFQLERLGPHAFKAATILYVTADHLDRHGDMAAYAGAKQRIYRNCEVAVAHRGDPLTYPADCPGNTCLVTTFGLDEPDEGQWGIRQVDEVRWLVWGGLRVLPAAEVPIAGQHNELNVLAAMALAASVGIDTETMAIAVRSFQGLAHRCQRVASIAGVEFINDSKATNVGATQAALLGLSDAAAADDRRIVLIAGGDGKGADFAPLVETAARFVKALVLLGRDAPRLAEAFADHRSVQVVHRVQNMRQAVELAAGLAEAGDLVLLSPACSSLDMYPNFAARGDDFSRAVEALAA